MALKGDRNVIQEDISYFSSAVAERGGVMSVSTAGSGSSLDQSANVATYATNASGAAPVGLLLAPDLVNVDTSRYPLNSQKLEARIGSKVDLMTRGWVVTNMLDVTAGNPIAGSGAFLAGSGKLCVGARYADSIRHTLGYHQPRVGYFGSTLDEDGYAKVFIDIG